MTASNGHGNGHGQSHGHGHETPGPGGRFDGARIPDQPFSHDDGATPPAVAAALAAFHRDRDLGPVVAALVDSRLLVGLLAVLDSVAAEGSEKDSHMAAAMLERPGGRKALVAFTAAAALARWHADARPLPVTAVAAAQAAIDAGADTLLVDGTCEITGAHLWALAEGRVPGPAHEDERVRAVVASTVTLVLGERGLPTHHEVVDGRPDADVVVLLDAAVAGVPSAVAGLAEVLAADPVLRSRLPRGLAIGVSGASTRQG